MESEGFHLAGLFCQTVSTVLGSGEHDAASDHLAFEEVDEQLPLVRFLNERHVLLDAVRGWRFGADVHVHRTVQHLIGQLADGFGHGRA